MSDFEVTPLGRIQRLLSENEALQQKCILYAAALDKSDKKLVFFENTLRRAQDILTEYLSNQALSKALALSQLAAVLDNKELAEKMK
jgi:hypothetical protein